MPAREHFRLTNVNAPMEMATPPEAIPDSILLAAARLQAALDARNTQSCIPSIRDKEDLLHESDEEN